MKVIKLDANNLNNNNLPVSTELPSTSFRQIEDGVAAEPDLAASN